ncbi:SDR family oxidoreductase [Nesterenkonia natronophila]|uniref:NAD(P)-dependent oxidoreductase n=1 Tax=Nesterenkonia natronophila TaxID=2174932 RepID=A0A3A4F305_9MICC|nr:NAD(P)-dependent oxidoreductase [Nesterenkonia natronophila]RJN32228.1 NAD(P)-dependent oxidoreductase [Nesterenkonia natronophila]
MTTDALASKTVLISGGSRGIGHAIAVKLASAGANIVLLAKTDQPHDSLPGTVHTAVADVESAGGTGLAVVGDIRNDEDVTRAVESAVERFGGIDAVVNNASAIDLSPAEYQHMKRYDLMHDINARGTFALSRAAIPHLRASADQHGWTPKILTLSPPLNLDPAWFGKHLAYTMSKYAMSMTTLGLAAELADAGVSVNSLWPATLIETSALRSIPGGEQLARGARTPEIVADAASALITGEADLGSGVFLTDEQVLTKVGISDLARYAVDPDEDLVPDIFL